MQWSRFTLISCWVRIWLNVLWINEKKVFFPWCLINLCMIQLQSSFLTSYLIWLINTVSCCIFFLRRFYFSLTSLWHKVQLEIKLNSHSLLTMSSLKTTNKISKVCTLFNYVYWSCNFFDWWSRRWSRQWFRWCSGSTRSWKLWNSYIISF